MDKLLENKRTFISSDGEEYLNLGSRTVNIDDIKINGYIKVNQDCKGRIDKFVYSNVSKNYNSIDLLMYANHIFNPFAIDDGDILYTPIYNEELFTKSEDTILPDETIFSSNGDKSSMTYAERVAFMAKQGNGWK